MRGLDGIRELENLTRQITLPRVYRVRIPQFHHFACFSCAFAVGFWSLGVAGMTSALRTRRR